MDDSKLLLERAARYLVLETTFDLGDVREGRARRERRRKWSAGVVGLGLTMAVVVGAAFVSGSFETGDRPGRSVADGSLPASRAFALGPGEYSYQRIRIGGTCDGCGRTALLVESWWAWDDSGRIKVLEQHNYGIAGGSFEAGEFPDEGDLSAFPTDPDALAAFLLQRSSEDGASPRPDVTPAPGTPLEEGQLWLAIRDYLGSPQYLNTTPELRAAMLRVLANVPMVQVDVGVVDPLGRPATGLRFHAYDADIEVFVEPNTGDFMAMTESFDDGGEDSTVVEAAGIADEMDAGPDGDRRTIRVDP
jgi:hypothetical protein